MGLEAKSLLDSLSYPPLAVSACGLVKASALLAMHFKILVWLFFNSHRMLGQVINGLPRG